MRRGVLLLSMLILSGCMARTDRVYLYQRDATLPITDADWTACDKKADNDAYAEYYNARNQWAILGGAVGGAVGGAIAGAAISKQDPAEPPALRVKRDQTYEDTVRQCLKKRGYAIEAPPVVERGFGTSKP